MSLLPLFLPRIDGSMHLIVFGLAFLMHFLPFLLVFSFFLLGSSLDSFLLLLEVLFVLLVQLFLSGFPGGCLLSCFFTFAG